MRFYKTPALVRTIFPQYTWRLPPTHPTIYLTFDDGPIPEVTEFVLAQLAYYQARATFFCVGENIHHYPAIARQVAAAGHRLGNHTYNHLRGWNTPTAEYTRNINLCQHQIERLQPEPGKLFRPPHGQIRRAQYQEIKADYQVIMWDVLTYDFDAALSPDICLQQAIKHTGAGSVVVFHDSLKARRNVQYVLPRFLDYFANLGYGFATL